MSIEMIVTCLTQEYIGDDEDLIGFLNKISRTCKDMAAGRPVRKWRLDRLQKYCEFLSIETLKMAGSPGCGHRRGGGLF